MHKEIIIITIVFVLLFISINSNIVFSETTFTDNPNDFFIMSNVSIPSISGGGGAAGGPEATTNTNKTPQPKVVYSCVSDEECRIILNTQAAFCRNSLCTTEVEKPVEIVSNPEIIIIPLFFAAAVVGMVLLYRKSRKENENKNTCSLNTAFCL